MKLGEARKMHLGPLSASFPVKWHFALLSYLPAKLWPVLFLTLISSSLKLAWPLKKMSPHLCFSSAVHGVGIVLVLEDKFQAFTGNFSDRAGKGGEAMPVCAFSKLGFRDTISSLSTQPCWTWEKWAPDKQIFNPIFCFAVTDRSILKQFWGEITIHFIGICWK